MPFKPPPQVKCPKCGNSVYAAEEKVAGGMKFHKQCFKCGLCQKTLESTNLTEHGGDIFCKQCHARKFGPKGYGFGQGAGALGMDSGEAFGNTESEMTNRPSGWAPQGGTGGTGPKCPRCAKSVYEAEKAIGTAVPWHKTCFSCAACRKKLDSATMAERENEVFCRNCYAKNFGPRGIGFSSGQAL